MLNSIELWLEKLLLEGLLRDLLLISYRLLSRGGLLLLTLSLLALAIAITITAATAMLVVLLGIRH